MPPEGDSSGEQVAIRSSTTGFTLDERAPKKQLRGHCQAEDLDIDGTWLIASFVIGSIGFVLLVYGRKQRRAPHLVCGLTLVVYPYFVHDAMMMSLIAAVLTGLLWFLVKRLEM